VGSFLDEYAGLVRLEEFVIYQWDIFLMKICYFPLRYSEISDNEGFFWSGAGAVVDGGAKFSF
jgi:hypothetical protein